MKQVLLVHWKETELPERLRRLASLRLKVATHSSSTATKLPASRENPPDAIIIDLSRLPSHGRAMGFAFRQLKATRTTPILFVEGDPLKVSRIRKDMPDAVFTTWPDLAQDLKQALADGPAEFVVPRSMSGYSGTPLPRKLGVDAVSSIALLNAPDGFETKIVGANTRVEIHRSPRRPAEMVIWFVGSRSKLRAGMPRAKKCLAKGGALWIAWPKKSSGVASDLGEDFVRSHALAAGLVDYKVCAIDQTWSGLKFARRRPR